MERRTSHSAQAVAEPAPFLASDLLDQLFPPCVKSLLIKVRALDECQHQSVSTLYCNGAKYAKAFCCARAKFHVVLFT